MNCNWPVGVLALGFALQAGSMGPAELAEEQIWHAREGAMDIEIRGDFLPDFGIGILHHGEPVTTRRRIDFPVESIEPFRLLVPYGNLEALDPTLGLLAVQTGLEMQYAGNTVDLDRLYLVVGQRDNHPTVVFQDAQGRPVLTLTHMHIATDHQRGRLTIRNAELEATSELADQLGLAVLADMPIGLGWMDLALDVPAGAETSGQEPGCSERPIWPQQGQFEAEVALIAMNNVVYQGTHGATGLVKVAPSATLKNVSLADIPWIRQFDSHPDYPHQPADQHPFLVWNMYRIKDGRIEMLAESGAKHAFFTVNFNCDLNCGDGNILWPGCEDIYSAGNNDTATHQGPKEEVLASLGLWDNCESFFDPECTGSQTQGSGQWLNRLLVHPGEFQHEGADYFMDAWYVIQHDINIWSTMGYRPINPQPHFSGWTFNPGPFAQGPVVNEWVGEGTSEAHADHRLVVIPSATPDQPYPGNMPQGHLRLLARVHVTDEGLYRYNYALHNYDFDRGVTAFHIPLAAGVTVSDTWFGGVGDMTAWSIDVGTEGVTFLAPEGEFQPWSTLFNFEIEVDARPVEGEVLLSLGNDAVMPETGVEILAPPPTDFTLWSERAMIGFGVIAVGTASVEEMELRNIGNAPVSIESMTLPQPPFVVDDSDCGGQDFTLEIDESCVLLVHFTPGESNDYGDEVVIFSNAPDSPIVVPLTGVGRTRELTVELTALDFGIVGVGMTASQPLVLQNTGELEVVVEALQSPSSPFLVDTADCGAASFTLAPGQACQILVDFSPLETGPYADQMVVESNAAEGLIEIELSGSAIVAELYQDRFEQLGLPGMPLRFDFNPVVVNSVHPRR